MENNADTQSMPDLRELNFQNVVDRVLRPAGVKVGGFPQELFVNLDDDSFESIMCNIWFVAIYVVHQMLEYFNAE